MRRVLDDHARNKGRQKRVGRCEPDDLATILGRVDDDPHGLLLLDDALTRLAAEEPPVAEVAKLHLFAGVSVEEAETALGTSRATAYRNWPYARAWLQDTLNGSP